MKSEVAGHITTETLIEIAQRLVARLQDAGVTHVRDLSVVFHPTDAKGLDVEVGTLAGPIDTLPLDCTHLTLSMPVHRISVLRQAPGRRPRPARQRSSPRE